MRRWYFTTWDKFWITNCDRMGYSATWIAKCDKMVYKVQQELNLKGGCKKRWYKASRIYTPSHCTVCYFKIKSMKKVFLIMGNILSEYIADDMI